MMSQSFKIYELFFFAENTFLFKMAKKWPKISEKKRNLKQEKSEKPTTPGIPRKLAPNEYLVPTVKKNWFLSNHLHYITLKSNYTVCFCVVDY